MDAKGEVRVSTFDLVTESVSTGTVMTDTAQ